MVSSPICSHIHGMLAGNDCLGPKQIFKFPVNVKLEQHSVFWFKWDRKQIFVECQRKYTRNFGRVIIEGERRHRLVDRSHAIEKAILYIVTIHIFRIEVNLFRVFLDVIASTTMTATATTLNDNTDDERLPTNNLKLISFYDQSCKHLLVVIGRYWRSTLVYIYLLWNTSERRAASNHQ